jgi:hypothetical protein
MFDDDTLARFNLEEAVVKQNNIVDDLNMIVEDILEGGRCSDPDYLTNALQGIINLHELRYEKLWVAFIMAFKLDGCGSVDYNHDEEDEEDDEVD